MCQDKLINYVGPKKEVIHGWKVFKQKNGELYSRDVKTYKKLKIKQWLHEKDYRLYYNKEYIEPAFEGGGKYTTGFHTFLNEEDAKAWAACTIKDTVVKEVLATNITSAGIHFNADNDYTIVTDNIYIL